MAAKRKREEDSSSPSSLSILVEEIDTYIDLIQTFVGTIRQSEIPKEKEKKEKKEQITTEKEKKVLAIRNILHNAVELLQNEQDVNHKVRTNFLFLFS